MAEKAVFARDGGVSPHANSSSSDRKQHGEPVVDGNGGAKCCPLQHPVSTDHFQKSKHISRARSVDNLDLPVLSF